jgi:hypothetical protein
MCTRVCTRHANAALLTHVTRLTMQFPHSYAGSDGRCRTRTCLLVGMFSAPRWHRGRHRASTSGQFQRKFVHFSSSREARARSPEGARMNSLVRLAE